MKQLYYWRSLDSGSKKKEDKKQSDESRKTEGKFFRVSITDTTTGKSRANIRMPLSVMGIGMRFGAHFAPQIDGVESEQLMDAIRNGQVEKLLMFLMTMMENMLKFISNDLHANLPKSDWKKTFFIIWTGQAFSLLGSEFVQFALVWYLTKQTGSASVLALASFVASDTASLDFPVFRRVG